jgi:hypothetical protein
LDALALLWTCAATAYLLMASTRRGIAASAVLGIAGDDVGRLPPSLATANGVWMAGLLMGLTLLGGMPLGIALAHPSGHRAAAWTVALTLLGFCFLSGFFVGLLYVPATVLLMIAGAVWKSEPPGGPRRSGW